MNLNMFPLLDTRNNKAFALELVTLAAMAGSTKRDTPTQELFKSAGYDVDFLEKQVKLKGLFSALPFNTMAIVGIDTPTAEKGYIQPFTTYISVKAFELLVKHDNTFAVKGYERAKGGFLFRALAPQGGEYSTETYDMRPSSPTDLFDNEDGEFGYIRYEAIYSDDYDDDDILIYTRPHLGSYLLFESAKRQEDATIRLGYLKRSLNYLKTRNWVGEEDHEEMWEEDHANSQKALKRGIYSGKNEDTTIEETRAQILTNSAILCCMFHLEQIAELNTFMKKVIVFEMMRVACVDDLASENALEMMKAVNEIFELPENFVDELLLAFSNNDSDEVIQMIEE